MSNGVSETNKVVTHAIKSVYDNFQYELLAKESIKKLPQHLFKQTNKMTGDILYVNNLPKPFLKHQSVLIEQQMPLQHPIQDMLSGCVPVQKKQYSLITPSTSNKRRNKSSRYGSAIQMERLKKHIHLNLNQIKQNKVIQISNRDQNTATSLRSVLQLQSHIKQMRSTYLKDLKQQARLKMSMTQQQFTGKKKRIPKQFTYDFSGDVMEKYTLFRKVTVFSPLRTKSVSVPKIEKRVKKANPNDQQQSNLEQKLSRINTGDNQKMRRQYNNKSKRQISHIPFIALSQNTKLFENNKMIEGPPNSQHLNSTGHSSHRTTFVHFHQKQKQNELLNNESKEISFYPNKSFQKGNNNSRMQGSITKNIKFYEKIQDNKEQFEDYISNITQSPKFKDIVPRRKYQK